MIDAKELRIGNWVIDRYTLSGDERFTQVVSLYHWKGNGSINASTDTDYYPIPLTTEILLGAGFEEKNKNSWFPYWQIEHTRIIVKYTFKISTMGEDEWRWIEGNVNIPFYYVHQLQNLYFCITGTELNINL